MNAPIIKHFLHVVFVYGIKNVILVKKQKSKVENAQNNGFVIHATFEKRDVSAQPKSTLHDVNKSVLKNLVWSVKKIFPNVVQKISF